MEYLKGGENCKFEDDLIACFDLGVYDIFETNFERWNNGRSIELIISNDNILFINKSY
jgi:hypothetical protein